MSGPKCGRAELNRQRQEALRLQREREQRIRHAREAHRRDETRQKGLQGAMQRAESVLQHAQDLMGSLQTAISQYAAKEYQDWQQLYNTAKRSSEQTGQKLELAQEQFAQATKAWQANDESYEGAVFDTVDFSGAMRASEAALQDARRIARLVEARRAEATLAQERDQKQSDAQIALLHAHELQSQLQELSQGLVLSDLLQTVGQEIIVAENLLMSGQFEQALQHAQQVELKETMRLRELETALLSWQEYYNTTRHIVEDVQQLAQALDQEFIRKWAAGKLDSPLADLINLEKSLTSAEQPTTQPQIFDELTARAGAIKTALLDAQAIAEERRGEEMSRREVVKALDKALSDMNFNVGLKLEDVNNPLSDVLIDARHGSGQEMKFSVDHTRQINMNLEDGVRGIDCVADVYQLIQSLEKEGVELQMTDWGHAKPDRVQAMGVSKRKANLRQDGKAQSTGGHI